MKMKILVSVTTVVTILVNMLAVLLPINGLTTSQVSDMFATYFVPAGYVFSIWGIIYIGMIIYTIYQFLFVTDKQRANFSEIAQWYLIAGLANCIWIFLWQYEYFVATIFMMILLLISLAAIKIEMKKVVDQSKKYIWMVKIPFEIYLGWISVATIANVTDVLFSLGYTGNGYAITLAIVMMGVACLLALVMLFKENSIPFAVVVIWAIIGIGVKFSTVDDLVVTSIIVGCVLAGGIIVKLLLPPLVSARLKNHGKK